MQLEIRGAEKLSFRERQVVALKEMGDSTDKIAAKLNLIPVRLLRLFNRDQL